MKIHHSRVKVKAICGVVGSGKTSVACWEFWLLCYQSSIPIRGCVIRASYPELHDSTRKTVEDWFGGFSSYNESKKDLTLTFPGHDGIVRSHTLSFRACKREAEATKFLSTEFAFIWLEEAVPAFATSKSGGVMGQGLPFGLFNVAKLRLRQKGAPRLQIVVTFNPPPVRHWTYAQFFQATPDELKERNTAFFRQPPGENKQHLPPNYYEDLLADLPPDFARRFVKGEVVTVYEGERVFPECIDSVHIRDQIDALPGVPLTLGQDYGLTPCTLVTQILPGGQVLVLGELQMFNKGIKSYIEYLGPYLHNEFKDFPVRKVWEDPTGGSQRSQIDENETCSMIMSNAGYPMEPSDNNWMLRREITKQRFEWSPGGRPGILISRQDCPILVEGLLGGYRYPMMSSGIHGSSPIKNEFSHLQDALQMVLVGEFSAYSGLTNKDELSKRNEITLSKRARYNPLSNQGLRTPGSHHSWLGR